MDQSFSRRQSRDRCCASAGAVWVGRRGVWCRPSTLSGNPCCHTATPPTTHNWMIIYPPISLQPDLPFPITTLYHISHKISSDVHCSTEQPGTQREGTTCGITRRGCVSTTPTTGATVSRTALIAPLPMVQTTLGHLYMTAGMKLWDD